LFYLACLLELKAGLLSIKDVRLSGKLSSELLAIEHRASLLTIAISRVHAERNTMDLPKKDDTQLVQTSASSDMEDGVIVATYTVKRDLERRHINMIAIAGMIVSGI
jgi:hypothetical protein